MALVYRSSCCQDGAEQFFPVPFLLLVPRAVGDELLTQKLHNDPSEKSVQRESIRCRDTVVAVDEIFLYPEKATKYFLGLSYHILWKKKRTTTKKEDRLDRFHHIL